MEVQGQLVLKDKLETPAHRVHQGLQELKAPLETMVLLVQQDRVGTQGPQDFKVKQEIEVHPGLMDFQVILGHQELQVSLEPQEI